jgi:hemerythrin-like metal-binding protein
MASAFWKDEYSVGNEEIDKQHQHILALVNALEIAGTSGEGAGTADLVLSHLLRYLSQHFAAEEELLASTGYPGLETHQREHAECTSKVESMVRAVASSEMTASECVPFFCDWLHEHLLGSDLQYAAWAKRNSGVRGTRVRAAGVHTTAFAIS